MTAEVQVAAKPRSKQPSKRWYHYLTLDLIISVLARSVFHPAIVMVFYLCLASLHKHRQPLAHYTLYWAAALAVVEIAIYINYRITYGWPRKVKWENEVVVITGGASGLGRVLAEMLMISKGVRTAVLDVKQPDEEAKEWIEGRGGFVWEVCDVSDPDTVQRACERIQDELGAPTILINNAATPVNGQTLLPQPGMKTINPAQAAKTLQINTLSHFNTLTAFLPSLMSSEHGGHVVTVSSILAQLNPANLSDYNASKAAASAIHHTLNHEIARHPSKSVRKHLKTILVEPGQIDTQLFAGITSVPWYANFFGPVLEVNDLAKEIVRMIERGESAVMRTPLYCSFMPLYGFLPGAWQQIIRWFSGVDVAIAGTRKKD